MAAVREERMRIIPAMFKDTWYDWLENIRDWCISRCGATGMGSGRHAWYGWMGVWYGSVGTWVYARVGGWAVGGWVF